MRWVGPYQRLPGRNHVARSATLDLDLRDPVGITTKEFEALKSRLTAGRGKSVPAPVSGGTTPSSRAVPEVVLGIDPSLRGTGFGVIRPGRPYPETLAYGTIQVPRTWEHSRCLAEITAVLRRILNQHRPTVCVIEGLFYAQNLKTALTMGEARGAALATVAEAGLEIYELAPRRMKQAIVGYGAAQKDAVARMVQRLLHLSALPEPDAADALALALVHAQDNRRYAIRSPRRV